ncbi:MAG: hypothetical protein A2X49_15530 [Lentisphaerae bacterium GWF2_52_8]|nr:MAG: hypothetical protein A2X49_15530 [Lentisphaerae bacterium GWF2_52_8]
MLREQSVKIKRRCRIIGGLPDLSPMIGVFFLLLIFFMLGSSFIQVSGIPVKLPEAATRAGFSAEKFAVTVDSENRIYFNDHVVKPEFLKERLLENSALSRRNTLLIRADSQASFRVIAQILALAEELNLNAFLLTVPPARKEVLKDAGSEE